MSDKSIYDAIVARDLRAVAAELHPGHYKAPADVIESPWVLASERVPEKNTLVLAYLVGEKYHSDMSWKREGYWLLPYHDPEGWAAAFLREAEKKHDADILSVYCWMPIHPVRATGREVQYTNCDLCDVNPGHREMNASGVEGGICESCDEKLWREQR